MMCRPNSGSRIFIIRFGKVYPILTLLPTEMAVKNEMIGLITLTLIRRGAISSGIPCSV